MRFLLAALFLLLLSLSATAQEDDGEASRLSAIVAFTPKSEAFDSWLNTLDGKTYMQAWVRFPAVTGDDVIMALDQEYTEGVKNPRFTEGGDWMAFAGVQRNGTVWIGGGTEDTMRGIPSKERNWKILSVGKDLQPDTWYRLRTEVDFANRRYVSFSIYGPDIVETFDIGDVFLDYPNYMPFNLPGLTNYVVVMRGKDLMADTGAHGAALAFFDDMEAGLVDGPVFVKDDFDDEQDMVPQQQPKYEDKTILMSNYKRGKWYLEQEKARCRFTDNSAARSGKKVALCDGTLQKVSYEEWFDNPPPVME